MFSFLIDIVIDYGVCFIWKTHKKFKYVIKYVIICHIRKYDIMLLGTECAEIWSHVLIKIIWFLSHQWRILLVAH